jgi:hypothetical protein
MLGQGAHTGMHACARMSAALKGMECVRADPVREQPEQRGCVLHGCERARDAATRARRAPQLASGGQGAGVWELLPAHLRHVY